MRSSDKLNRKSSSKIGRHAICPDLPVNDLLTRYLSSLAINRLRESGASAILRPLYRLTRHCSSRAILFSPHLTDHFFVLFFPPCVQRARHLGMRRVSSTPSTAALVPPLPSSHSRPAPLINCRGGLTTASTLGEESIPSAIGKN